MILHPLPFSNLFAKERRLRQGAGLLGHLGDHQVCLDQPGHQRQDDQDGAGAQKCPGLPRALHSHLLG